MLCVRPGIVRVSDGLVWLVSLVFHYWGGKDAVCVALTHVFWITAGREMVPISLDASPFHQIGWAELYWKNAFVRLRILMLRYSIMLSAKEATQPRLAQILRKTTAKRTIAAGTNSPSHHK